MVYLEVVRVVFSLLPDNLVQLTPIKYVARGNTMGSTFVKVVHDSEVESAVLFHINFYLLQVWRKEERMCWRLKEHGMFDFHSYYESLIGSFPWRAFDT